MKSRVGFFQEFAVLSGAVVMYLASQRKRSGGIRIRRRGGGSCAEPSLVLIATSFLATFLAPQSKH
jgi:hypothetical protein